MHILISILKLITFIIWSLISIPTQALSAFLFGNTRKLYIFRNIYNSVVCKIYCIKVHIEGTPDITNHVVFVGNHLSYIDIPCLGATRHAKGREKGEGKKGKRGGRGER